LVRHGSSTFEEVSECSRRARTAIDSWEKQMVKLVRRILTKFSKVFQLYLCVSAAITRVPPATNWHADTRSAGVFVEELRQ
jgi:hypothetical protein